MTSKSVTNSGAVVGFEPFGRYINPHVRNLLREHFLKPTLMPTFLALLLFSSNVFAAAPECADLFAAPREAAVVANIAAFPAARQPAAGQRPLETVKQIKMMAYNVENMFMHLGKYENIPLEKFKKMIDGDLKPASELQGVAQAIKDENPDFVVMEEVEGLEALQTFASQYLGGTYEALLIEGNDQRGIQIGYLVKKDLPLKVTLETHKDAMWTDQNGEEEKVFSRDAPALMVRRATDAPGSAPALIFIGNHAKSQRDSGGDPKSHLLRTAQMKEIAEIVTDYQKQYGVNTPIVVGGDFNIDVRNSPDTQPIRDIMQDPFDIKGVRGLDRMTHTFHPRGGSSSFSQLDALFLTPSLADNVVSIEAYRYKDAQGNPKPLPQSYAERSQNPSDHFPIVVTLSTEDIFPEAYKKAN